MQAGLTDILIITGRGKRAIEDHFDRNFELEHYLESSGKHDLLEGGAVRVGPRRHPLRPPARPARSRPRGVGRASSRRQRAVRGAARPTTSWSTTARCCARCSTCTTRYGRSVVALQGGRARGDLVVRLRRARWRGRRRRWSRCVASSRSRQRDEAPSNLAVIGRYVFTPEIFDALDRIEPGAGGELQLTDAIGLLLEDQTVFGRALRRAAATTSARRSISCARTSSSRSTAPTSARSSPRSCASSFTGAASCERVIP